MFVRPKSQGPRLAADAGLFGYRSCLGIWFVQALGPQIGTFFTRPLGALCLSPASDFLVIPPEQNLGHGESAVFAGPRVLGKLEQSILA
jgi:hypothetical protein